jgi:uroporphyrinogen-III synthase
LAEDLAARGFAVRRLALYAIEAADQLPPQAAAALKERALDGALFFSPRSARIFRELADGWPTENLTAFCISAATAEALAPMVFACIKVAARPNQAAMLALLD